jgi:2-polyprenyl-3-methyl-5-hydroxy-6-metoxy-1,4-benzoquinol methylase
LNLSESKPTRNAPPSAPSCPACSAAAAFLYDGSDRLFGLVPGSFPLYRCSGCECIFQFPLPEERALGAYYPDDYWWAGNRQSGGGGTLKRLERIYREFVARDHVRFLVRCARQRAVRSPLLLDVGCGNGTILAVARRSGFRTFGMDRSAHAVAAARKLYNLDVRRGDIGAPVWEGMSFDFVSLFHVLEHLPDPRAALRYAAALLRPHGSLIVQVPNVASAQARVFGRRWYGLDVPRHVINYSPRALEIVLRECGFVVRDSARFSLRDNPASIASSLAPALDPIGRRGRRAAAGRLGEAALEFSYLGLYAASILPALAESLIGRGGTLWVHAGRAHFR